MCFPFLRKNVLDFKLGKIEPHNRFAFRTGALVKLFECLQNHQHTLTSKPTITVTAFVFSNRN